MNNQLNDSYYVELASWYPRSTVTANKHRLEARLDGDGGLWVRVTVHEPGDHIIETLAKQYVDKGDIPDEW